MLNFRYWIAEVRRESRSVQRECIEDDGTVYPLSACAAMVVRGIREQDAEFQRRQEYPEDTTHPIPL
jgi:hypothetical protein